MARLGAQVTAIDPSEECIAEAKAHAVISGLSNKIDYRVNTVDKELSLDTRYDVVLASEVIEHVPHQEQFIKDCFNISNHSLIVSTISRTPKAYAVVILAAEYLTRILPRATHDYNKFITPQEMKNMIGRAGGNVLCVNGIVFNPMQSVDRMVLSEGDFDVNYIVHASK